MDVLDSDLSPQERRAIFRAGWDARLTPLLSDEWQSADAIAARLNEAKPKVLERLKCMSTRDLAERRIVRLKPEPKPGVVLKKRKKRPRVHSLRMEAQFRLPAQPLAQPPG